MLTVKIKFRELERIMFYLPLRLSMTYPRITAETTKTIAQMSGTTTYKTLWFGTVFLISSSIIKSLGGPILTPLDVVVENSISVWVEPASLCAVKRRLYHDAVFRSRITRFSVALLATKIQGSVLIRLRYSTVKCWIGHPPLGQDNKFNFTDVLFAEIISFSLGNRGAGI